MWFSKLIKRLTSTHNTNKTYHIQSNGGRTFKVVVNGLHVKVKRMTWNDETRTQEEIGGWVIDERFRKVFIGKSPKEPFKCKNNNYVFDPRYDGNTILLEKESGKYLFLSEHVYEFQPSAPIVKFISFMGNNSVPYPWAVDKKHNCYCLAWKQIIPDWTPSSKDLTPYMVLLAKKSYTVKNLFLMPDHVPVAIPKWSDPTQADNLFKKLTHPGKTISGVVKNKRKTITRNEFQEHLQGLLAATPRKVLTTRVVIQSCLYA